MEETNLSTETLSEPSTESEQTAPADSSLISDNTEITSEIETEESSDTEEVQEEGLRETASKVLSLEEKYGSFLAKSAEQELTEEEYIALENKGVSREEFDLLSTAYKGQIEKNDQELLSSVGGKEAYREIQSFANSTYSPEDLEVLNTALNTDISLAKLVIRGIKAQMEETQGVRPSMTIEASGVTAPSESRYNSRDEYFKEKRNPSYGKDKEYTKRVDARRNASGF